MCFMCCASCNGGPLIVESVRGTQISYLCGDKNYMPHAIDSQYISVQYNMGQQQRK